MKKQVLVNSLIYSICMVVACLLNLAVSALILKIVSAFVVMDYFSASVLRVVVGFFTGGTVIGAVIYRESYRSLQFPVGITVLSMLLAGAAHLILCLLLMFYPFIAGGVRYLAGILCMGTGFDSAAMIEDIYLWAYVLAFFLYLVFEICVSLIGGFLGKRMRLKNRESIKGYPASAYEEK